MKNEKFNLVSNEYFLPVLNVIEVIILILHGLLPPSVDGHASTGTYPRALRSLSVPGIEKRLYFDNVVKFL